ncbi:tetratricopeptide repeat protein [Streptosporangium sp. NPDC005286]|uniref:ATP-binding protein n=1 Tax=Streptosporangium sp. NPDC005286 TaxID=3154463 RepID=UPI0033B8BFFC
MLLRRHRIQRQLTQEVLAERSGISSRSIREMERGPGRSPRPQTIEQLATALALTGDERAEFTDAGHALFWANRAGRSSRNKPSDGNIRAVDSPPWQLPADLPDFVGRGEELALVGEVLDPTIRGARLVVASGPPGVGKTALAIHAGHRLAPLFPDGQLYATLRGATSDPADPAEVLAQLLRMLGVDGSALPAGVDARAGLLRIRLAGRRVLIVLDDAGGYRQVEPLLPAEGVAMIVTSRLPLTGLPGVTAIDLRPLPDTVAVDLLARVAGVARVRAEPVAAAELVKVCGGLPLAVRIVAARLAARPHWAVGALTERLTDECHRLDELRHGDLAVRPGLQLAYRGLSPATARVFALLGGLNVPSFPEWPVAALLDAEPAAGAAALEELLDARLLDDLGPDRAGQPRYRFHAVTQLYARERREAEIGRSEWVAALTRTAGGWLALARQAQNHLHSDRFHLDDRSGPPVVADPRAAAVAAHRPIEWFEAERESIAVLVQACAETGLTATARGLVGCSTDFYDFRGYYDDLRRILETALTACRQAGDRLGEAAMLRGLGHCLVELDDMDEGLAMLHAARVLAERVGDPSGAALARRYIGFTLGLIGRLDEAEAEIRVAVRELRLTGQRSAEAVALASLGFVLRQRGDSAEAVDILRAASLIARSCGDRFAQAYSLRGLSGAFLAQGKVQEAQRAARRSVTLFEQIGDLIGTAQSLRVLGEALAHEPHRLVEAERVLGGAAALFRERGHSWGLALTELSLGEVELGRDAEGATDRLHRSLRYWTDNQVPALRARTLVALASAAERAGDPDARRLLASAHRIYRELGIPAANALNDTVPP